MGATAAAAQAIVTSRAGDAASPPAREPQGNLGGRRVLLDCAGLFRSCFRSLRAVRNGRQAQTEGPAPTELRQPPALSARESRGSARNEGPGDASRPVRARTFSPAPATASVLRSPPLPGEPPEGSKVGARAGVVDTGTAAVERDTGLTELPWLTHRQNVERLDVNRLLAGPKPLHVAAQQWDALRNAFRRVVRIETDIREADALLQRSRTDTLSEAESQRLREIVDRYRQGAMNGHAEFLRATLSLLRKVGGFETADRTAAANLEARFNDVRGHYRDQTWEGPGKVVKLVLPLGGGKEIEVESRVVPCEAWRSYFPGGYHSQGPRSFTNFLTHVPGLGHTTATNASGEVIYSGLCHDLVSKQCVSAEALAQFDFLIGGSGELLMDALRNLPTNEHISEELGVNVGAEIDRLLSGREEPDSNALTNRILRTGVAHKMVTEVALAALVTDPPKLQKALEGEQVGVNLCWLVDLTEPPGTVGAKINSLYMFGQSSVLAEKSPLELSVRGPDGQLRTVNVDLKIRTFIYDPYNQCGQLANLHAIVKDSWVELLGSQQSGELGGDVLAKTNAMAVRAQELHNEIATIDRESTTVAVGRDAAVPVSPGAGEIRAGLESELRLLEKNRGALLRLGKEQKAMATNGLFLVPLIERTSDNTVFDFYMETISRLALICHLMGETPVLSKSGGEGVKHLDVAVKFLATVADSGEGSLPPLIPDEEWLQCHQGFLVQVAPQAKSLVNFKALGTQHLMATGVPGL